MRPDGVDVLGLVVASNSEADPITIGSPQQRQVLALLVAAEPHTVSVESLIDQLWPELPPAHARKTIQVYVSGLRRCLNSSQITIETVGSAYRIVIPGRTDVSCFDEAVVQARDLSADHPLESIDHYEIAESLWRGSAYADIGQCQILVAEATRLEQIRRTVQHEFFALALRTGERPAGDIAARLAGLVADEQLHEPTWALLAEAEYREGRQADALQTLQQARSILLEELGVEPSETIRSMEARILTQDPLLDRPHQVGGPGASTGDQPAVKATPHPHRHSFPEPGDLFIGRDIEMATLGSLVDDNWLVTMVGPGGVGKTRLMVEAIGRDIAGNFDDVWLADLCTVPEADQLIEACTAAAGIHLGDRSNALDAIAAAVGNRSILLALDNAEHLSQAVAMLATSLKPMSGLKLLATSRRPLHVDEERVFIVEPMTGQERGEDAVELMVERAGRFGVPLQALADLELVRSLCDEVDGLPLGIELAARRLRTMSVAEIRSGLRRRFDAVDPANARSETPGRGTVRATIEWSYRLLDPSDRQRFDRLGVLAPGFRRREAIAIAGNEPGVSFELEVEACLDELIELSLLTVRRHGEHSRLTLLEGVRSFARQRLTEQGLNLDLRARHRTVYLARAREIVALYLGPNEAQARRDMAAEIPNYREFVRTAIEDGDTDRASELMVTLYPILHEERGSELAQWPALIATMPGIEHHRLGAGFAAAQAEALFHQGDLPAAAELAKRGIDRSAPIDAHLARCHGVLGQVLAWQGQLEESARAHELAADLSIDDPWFATFQRIHRLYVARTLDDPETLEREADAVVRFADALGQPLLRSHARYARGMTRISADPSSALVDLETCIELAIASGNFRGAARTRVMLTEIRARTDHSVEEVLAHELACLRDVGIEAGVVYLWDSLRMLIPWLDKAGLDDLIISVSAAFGNSPLKLDARLEKLVSVVERRLDPTAVLQARHRGGDLGALAARQLVEADLSIYLSAGLAKNMQTT